MHAVIYRVPGINILEEFHTSGIELKILARGDVNGGEFISLFQLVCGYLYTIILLSYKQKTVLKNIYKMKNSLDFETYLPLSHSLYTQYRTSLKIVKVKFCFDFF